MTVLPFSIASIAPALIGGALIGLAAVALMASTGRVAGVSGIVSSIVSGIGSGARAPRNGDVWWRVCFVLGLIAGALVAFTAFNVPRPAPALRATEWLMLSGLLVGMGTTLGGGCTSGHGVCGIARGSARSIVATLIFMVTGAAVVYILRHAV